MSNLQRKGSTYFGLCPFHNEKSPSFSVTPGKQMYYCFGCGAGGNVFTFIMEYENYTFPEALKYLADRAGVELPEHGDIRREDREQAGAEKQDCWKSISMAAKYYYYQLRTENGGQAAWQYLKGRELSDETMHKFGLGYSNKFGNGPVQISEESRDISDELLRRVRACLMWMKNVECMISSGIV